VSRPTLLLFALLLFPFTALAGTPTDASQGERAEDSLSRARDLIAEERVEAAEDVLRAAIVRWPEHHDLHVLAGWVAFWSGRPADAVVDFEAASVLAPESLDAWDGLVHTYAAVGRSLKSQAALSRAQRLDTDLRSREERALRMRWISGDVAWVHMKASGLAARYGASELTDAIGLTPLGFDARGWFSLAFRKEAPLARVGTQLRMRPHELLAFFLRFEGSTWLGDKELSVGGGAQLITKGGFSVLVHGAGGIPGLRESRLEIGLGFGWRLARIVELEAGWTLRRWGSGTTLHLARLGGQVQFPWGMELGATGYLGLVRPAQAPRFRVVPGARVFVRQPVRDPLKVEMSYTVGSEIIVHPVTFEESNLVTHELKFGAHIEATARLGFTASYSLLAWTDTPVFHALGVEVRTLW